MIALREDGGRENTRWKGNNKEIDKRDQLKIQPGTNTCDSLSLHVLYMSFTKMRTKEMRDVFETYFLYLYLKSISIYCPTPRINNQ